MEMVDIATLIPYGIWLGKRNSSYFSKILNGKNIYIYLSLN
jgi:hypothetical protein